MSESVQTATITSTVENGIEDKDDKVELKKKNSLRYRKAPPTDLNDVSKH